MTPQLTSKSLSKLLEKHPSLKTPIEQGRFLTGYTDGGYCGNQVSVFLIRSPWTQFCLQAEAIGILPQGGVLLITEETNANPQGSWKAYSLEAENKSFNNNRISHPNHRNESQTQGKLISSLSSTATSIAIETERKYSSRRLREMSQQQLVK